MSLAVNNNPSSIFQIAVYVRQFLQMPRVLLDQDLLLLCSVQKNLANEEFANLNVFSTSILSEI